MMLTDEIHVEALWGTYYIVQSIVLLHYMIKTLPLDCALY